MTNKYVLYSHYDNTDTNAGGRCCFRYERFINFLTSVLRHEERETRLILGWPHPQRAAYLVMSKISRPENLTAAATVGNTTLCLNGRNSTDSFSKSSNSQDHLFRAEVIHTLAAFPVWGVYYDKWWLSYPLCTSVKLHPMTMHLNS